MKPLPNVPHKKPQFLVVWKFFNFTVLLGCYFRIIFITHGAQNFKKMIFLSKKILKVNHEKNTILKKKMIFYSFLCYILHIGYHLKGNFSFKMA